MTILSEAMTAADQPATTMTKADLLDIAKAAVADRGLNYGKPEDNFGRIAELWNAHLYNRFGDVVPRTGLFNPTDVAMMMVLMKIARLEHTSDHMDSWIDVAGYAACGGEIAARL